MRARRRRRGGGTGGGSERRASSSAVQAELSEEAVKLLAKADVAASVSAGLFRQGRYQDAADADRRALELCREAHGTEAHLHVACCHSNLGVSLRAAGQTESALDSFRAALRIRLDIHRTKQHQDIADCWINIAAALFDKGDTDDALAAYRDAEAMYVAVHGSRENEDVAKCVRGVGECLRQQADVAAALEQFREALRLFRVLHGDTPTEDLAGCQRAIGGILHTIGDNAGALSALREARNSCDYVHKEAHPDTAACETIIGNVLCGVGDCDGAMAAHAEARRILLAVYRTEEHPNVASCHTAMAGVLDAAGDAAGAARHYRIAQELRQRLGGETDRRAFEAQLLLAQALERSGAPAEEVTAAYGAAQQLSLVGGHEPPAGVNLAALSGTQECDGGGPVAPPPSPGHSAAADALPVCNLADIGHALPSAGAGPEDVGSDDALSAITTSTVEQRRRYGAKAARRLRHGEDEILSCAWCGREEEELTAERFQRCSGCLAVRYCGADCQHAHWPQHQAVCRQP